VPSPREPARCSSAKPKMRKILDTTTPHPHPRKMTRNNQLCPRLRSGVTRRSVIAQLAKGSSAPRRGKNTELDQEAVEAQTPTGISLRRSPVGNTEIGILISTENSPDLVHLHSFLVIDVDDLVITDEDIITR
jgi:hypothetical protein